jgi:hypothetical protein
LAVTTEPSKPSRAVRTSPDQQHAEQSLQFPVIFRKITFGNQSLRGAHSLATNLSLVTTAKRHGRDPLELIKTVLPKASDTPLDALYDPDCLSKNDSS